MSTTRPTCADLKPARRASVLALVAMLSLPIVADRSLAQSSPCGPAPASASGTEAGLEESGAQYVTNVEKLALRFHAYPELSGEYRVNADNTISIPVIGRVKTDGVTAACLEAMLAKRASEIARRDVFVTVEAVAYRPIFVAGAVARPGAVQWAPGMTVLQAVTLAGGRFRSTDAQSVMDPVRANKSFDDQTRALAALSRLRSERADRAQIEPEPELVQLVGLQEAKALVARQESLFASRRAARESAAATLERGMAVAREEIAALRQRRISVDEQLKLRRASLNRLTDLRAKGIVIADRVLEEDFKLAQLDEKAIDNSVALSRVSAALAGLEREMVTLKVGRMAEIDAEIGVQERIAAQSRIEVRAAQAAGNLAPAKGAQPGAAEIVTIVRRTESGQQHLTGDDATLLTVGDTIILSLQLQ